MDAIIPDADQKDFLTCYRGRQRAIHHMAYMRMSKVLLTLKVCQELGISLEDRDIFDYGFGAGTFFRYCPSSSKLFGVEIDPANVRSVREMLKERGHQSELGVIQIESWESHPLLKNKYDLILCSHVLEHIPRPVEFLMTMKQSLKPGGMFLALVPINERVQDPHHVQPVFEAKARTWARAAGMWLRVWREDDPWVYWVQPLFTHESGTLHKVAQVVSLALGIPATLMGPKLWFGLGRILQTLTGAKPMQAAFVLTAEPPPATIMPDPVPERRKTPERRFIDRKFLPLS